MVRMSDGDFEALVSVMKRAPSPLALIGAGASLPSGYPDWDGLLQQLAREASRATAAKPADPGYGVTPRQAVALRRFQDPPWQAEAYCNALGKDVFDACMRKLFRPRRVRQPHFSIARLPFHHFLTTNFDPCIERALRALGRDSVALDWSATPDFRDFLLNLADIRSRTRVVYLHGRFRNGSDAVLTESEYVERYVASEDARQKLLAIFLTQPVVFIGFSMNDPDLAQFMRAVLARLGRGQTHHFALMGYRTAHERDAVRERMMGKYGVRPVFYRVSGDKRPGKGDHSDLVELLDRLAARLAAEGVEVPEIPDEAAKLVRRALTKSAVRDPHDPQKGRWGGCAERNGRILAVSDVEAADERWLRFTLSVAPAPDAPPLESAVAFYLHPSFPKERMRVEPSDDGAARLRLGAYGAFTVGAVADEGRTRLELDLAEVDSLPDWFRQS